MRISHGLIALIMLWGITASAADSSTDTAEQLAAKNAEARGGLVRLHGLKTIVVRGKLLVNGGALELGYVQTRARGNAQREEISLQGLTQISATDGHEAWRISPFKGRKEPEKLSADDAAGLIEGGEIDGPLIDWREKGSVLDDQGREDVDGTLAYKVLVTRKDGIVQTVYLDPEHFLEIRVLSRRSEHGVEVVTQTDLGEYALVDGIYFPYAIASGAKGSKDPAQTQLELVQVNPTVAATAFSFPTSAAAASGDHHAP